MNETSSALEALKLIVDWAKWLITIETGAIAIIGAAIKMDRPASSKSIKVFATGAIVSFVTSIAAASALLLSLPDIAQNLYLRPGTNIWLTSDSVVGRVFHLNTQDFAMLESFFFGLGIVCFAALILAMTWSSTASPQAVPLGPDQQPPSSQGPAPAGGYGEAPNSD